MLKKLIIFFVLCIVLGCHYSKYKYSFFEGNWVLLNYLDTVQKYKSVSVLPYEKMSEIYLQRHVDSIYFFEDGVFAKSYPYQTITSNQISVLKEHNKPLHLFINEQAYYLSYSINGKELVYVKPHDKMIDSITESGYPSATQRVINSLVLAGVYQHNKTMPVQFYLNGNISGLPEFTSYEVLFNNNSNIEYNGDKLTMVHNGIPQPCTWEWQNNWLYIYKLVAAHNNIYKKGELVLKLVKLK